MHVVGRFFFTGLACLAMVSAAATPSLALTGGEVHDMCADYPNGKSRNTCQLYIQSMIEFATSDDKMVNPKGKLCIGSDVKLEEIVAIVNAWLAAHPDLRGANAYEATYPALVKHYRCK